MNILSLPCCCCYWFLKLVTFLLVIHQNCPCLFWSVWRSPWAKLCEEYKQYMQAWCFLLLFCYCFPLVEQWLHKLMKYFWKEYLCQVLCLLKWKHYVAYSQPKKCYNVILTVPAALLKGGTAWRVPGLDLKHPINDLCVVFDFPLSLSFICTKPLRECVLKQRFKPTPRDTRLAVRNLWRTLWSVWQQWSVRWIVLTKITVSSLALVWDLIFVFRCWVLLSFLFGQLSSLPGCSVGLQR